MAQRAIAVDMFSPRISYNGVYSVQFEIATVFIDTAFPENSKAENCLGDLDPAAPAGWNAAIKATMAARGVELGFTALTAANCFTPSFA